MGDVKMSEPQRRMLAKAHACSSPGDGLRISGMGQHATAAACERRGWVRIAHAVEAFDIKSRVHITVEGRAAIGFDAPPPEATAEERCPFCGYTEEDKRVHMDHHLCDARERIRPAAPRRQRVRRVPPNLARALALLARIPTSACPCQGEDVDPGPDHVPACPWSDPEYLPAALAGVEVHDDDGAPE